MTAPTIVNAALPPNAAAVDVSSVDYVPASPAVLLIATAGTIKVDTVGGDTGITLTVPVGYLLVPVTKVYASGTSAAGITALLTVAA